MFLVVKQISDLIKKKFNIDCLKNKNKNKKNCIFPKHYKQIKAEGESNLFGGIHSGDATKLDLCI